MLLSEITHKTTLKSIAKHNICIDELSSLEELRLIIRRASRRLWQSKNKEYFKMKYMNEYRGALLSSAKERTMVRQFMKILPHV